MSNYRPTNPTKAKMLLADLVFTGLDKDDLTLLSTKWGITPRAGKHYRLRKAYKEGRPDRTWLSLPVLDQYGREVFAQYRAWEGYHTIKYLSLAPSGPYVWYSEYFGGLDRPSNVVGIVEGILDGIRLSEVMPTIALLGSSLNEDKHSAINRILAGLSTTPHSASEGRASTVLVLDSDGVGREKSFKLQRQLGFGRCKVCLLPGGDPTDYTAQELAGFIEDLER